MITYVLEPAGLRVMLAPPRPEDATEPERSQSPEHFELLDAEDSVLARVALTSSHGGCDGPRRMLVCDDEPRAVALRVGERTFDLPVDEPQVRCKWVDRVLMVSVQADHRAIVGIEIITPEGPAPVAILKVGENAIVETAMCRWPSGERQIVVGDGRHLACVRVPSIGSSIDPT